MTELISKWDVVDKLTALENEFQQFKPFEGFEHAMYRKLCELEMEIGKTPGIAHGVTAQEWISVKDRLPEPFVSVLVQMPGEEPFPTVREGFISNDGVWQSAMFRREPGEVTHWQPMPQPPKGE